MDRFTLHFLGIGPQRTGTSWLEKLLRHHPQLCLPNDVKETRFFDLYYENGLDWYIWHFLNGRQDQFCGEIAPTYFDVEDVPKRVYKLNPTIRIIVSLRDPVSRVFSLYRHQIFRGHAHGSFQEVISSNPNLMESGKYSQHIPRWLKVFEDNVTFVVFEDIVSSPEKVFREICNFLGVEEIPTPRSSKEKVGVISSPRSLLLAGLSVKIANALRGHRLHKVVEAGKAIGLNRVVLSGGKQQIPEFTVDEKRWIVGQHEADIAFIESLLGRDLSKWRQVV